MENNPMHPYYHRELIPMQNSRIPPVNPPPLSQTNAGDQDNRSQLSDDEYFKNMPPGYRFRPTDDELIVEYLMKKVNNEGLPRNRIYMVKLYDFNPENLVERYKGSGENEWYFFTPREKKYRGGSRPKRAAGDGYWKATGADKTIVHNGEEVGYRKSLLYHKGRPPGGDRTCWLMNEYRLKNPPPPVQTSENSMRLDDWVLCRIHRKPGASNNNNRNQEAIDNTDEVVEEEIQNSTVAALEHEAEVPNVGTYSQPLNMVSSTRYFSPGESSSSAGIPGVPYIPLNHHQAGIPRVPSIRFSHPINHQAGIPRVPSIRFSHPINHQAGIPGIPSIPAYQQAGTSSNYYYNFPASIDMVPTMYPEFQNPIQGNHFTNGPGCPLLSQVLGLIQRSQDEDLPGSIVGSQVENPCQIPGRILRSQEDEDPLSQFPRPISRSRDEEFPGISGLDIDERWDLDYVSKVWSETPHNMPEPDR